MLKDEIEALRNYLNIEQVRFEEKLQVNFAIAPEAENFPLPNFLLHPLVENAVKYGMQTSDLPLQIEIKAEKKNNKLFIEVSNSGKWYSSNGTNPQQSNGMRVGIENVRKRLEQSFPGRHHFQTFERGNRVYVLLEIGE
jgi:LytS/YehU family sensor histidine kinase